MAGEPITSEMVQEAGIAAHLAADPDALPPEVSELSDQAAIFASNSTNAFMFTGAADADSAATNFGTSLATKAVERMIELEAERRKEDDPASDASMIAEAGARQRDAIAEMQSVTYSNGQFHMFGMDIDEEDMDAVVDETLENIDEIAARHGLDAQQTSQLTTWLMAYRNAETPEQKAEILGQIAEEHPEIAREMADQTQIDPEMRAQNELSADETQNAEINNIEGEVEFRQAALQTANETEVERAELARSGMSNAGNPFADTRSPNAEFNAQALDSVRVADADRVQSEPGQSQSQSVQEFRV
ncbi:hypothetical protein GRI72_09355 [Altererythrobacter marinus]|uniref:Uncharacterized protein n=1 Tax=Pelagerythrobacter marinus TaxID=538382 RepID=A0ABW9UZ03_9SPHN|nr:hypothetical protein [Pelagerythrobacter marinus]MXO69030.1 hypothetical protein [Pelagerythrobacter marinus]